MSKDLSNKAKYPLTTQDGLSVKRQSLIDALNLDDLREYVADGNELTEEERARLAELEEKHRIRMEGYVVHPMPTWMADLQDKSRFPLTTNVRLYAEGQTMLDALEIDELEKMIESGKQLSDEQAARFSELKEKDGIRCEEAIANGWKPGEPLPHRLRELPPQPKPTGDPRFTMTPEQLLEVARGHREMMSFPPSEPIK